MDEPKTNRDRPQLELDVARLFSAAGESGRMARDAAMDAQEASISRETAISCFILLNTRFGSHVNTENVGARQQFRGATLSMSKLIELASDFGFRAKYIRCDWLWLQLAVATQPVLLLLKNGNTIVSVGTGNAGAEEIVVCDPLHRGGVPIILSRDNIERAWSGDSLIIEPYSFSTQILALNRDVVFNEILTQAYPELRPADTCAMFADKLTSESHSGKFESTLNGLR
jgi:hypothetical protein